MTATPNPTTNDDLTLWLDIAADGLPRDLAPIITAELQAHYEAAVNDLRVSGMSAAQAQKTALAQLGEADTTNSALRTVHAAEKRYVLAGLASLMYPLLGLPVSFILGAFSWALNEIFSGAILFFPTFFVLMVFRRLLVERYNYDLPRWVIGMVTVGLGGFCLPLIFTWLLTRRGITMQDFQDTLAGDLGLFRVAFVIPTLLSFAVAGAGMLLLSWQVLRVPDRLYLLQKPLALFLAMSGFGLWGMLLCLVTANTDAYMFVLLISQMGFMVTCLLWAFIFLLTARAAERKHPMRVASRLAR
jgi:hypothetical protein